MSDTVLKVEGLYKRYRLGTVGADSFIEDLQRLWAKMRGKPDPFEQYITANELSAVKSPEEMKKLKARYVWALQDINFEVKQGEILGIIGKNGAGKSTLLKILSKTTAPTRGQVKIKGRIASLLEVGTGFHPELTGRENIFLNGHILGMTRHEIRARLDEIVDFAGVEAYLDTPVKRYSSGMYVRLAFAVAAHLLADILIVDEVLAVGDAEFQKKCIGKMKDVSSGEGRTVLFVSHSMHSVKILCSRSILLEEGHISANGDTAEIVNTYINRLKGAKEHIADEIMDRGVRRGNGAARFDQIFYTGIDQQKKSVFNYREDIEIHFSIKINEPLDDLWFSFIFASSDTGERIFSETFPLKGSFVPGSYHKYKCRLYNLKIRNREFTTYFWLGNQFFRPYDVLDNVIDNIKIVAVGGFEELGFEPSYHNGYYTLDYILSSVE